jgi:NAD(P)H-dependent flavin oxidoreductase YrpB (nitropropane dioxygenase family)
MSAVAVPVIESPASVKSYASLVSAASTGGGAGTGSSGYAFARSAR